MFRLLILETYIDMYSYINTESKNINLKKRCKPKKTRKSL
ncbi:hypothetical protein HMPREF9018_1044 [Prevotella amnii CRIS 21A-A]|uniref:Uncharacterized protein n=1 Tax=Prevotella amnii CRIS 21A-A TaxID=679191 RepID=E1GU28_9BACT|nr:hypothetical protein HMPREF9018_1044 [Prevotella amnii CRIS 21A-A]